MPRHLLVPALAVALAACDAAGPTLGDMAPESAFPSADPLPAALRRLTAPQRDNVLHDLFGPELVVPEIAEPDLVQGGLTSVGASAASFSPRGVETQEDAAFAIAAQVVEDDVLRDRVVPCDLSSQACLGDTVHALGRRLWRRPLTPDERDRLVDLGTQAASTLGSPDAGLEFALAAMLQSPKFLYRTELGTGDGTRELEGVELASRLSFFLWNSAPDDALLDAALAGELDTREGLFDHAVRMLDDERARRGIRAYFDDQLELHDLEGLRKDPVIFEAFTTQMREDAREETLRLLEHVVLDADTDFRDIMTTRQTFLSPYLASVYGLPAPSDEGFEHVWLPDSLPRAGLLGHASFLNLHAHQVTSSATLRGKAVRTRLLCQVIPAPPVNVDTSIPEPSGTAPTLRDRVAEHLEAPACRGCHELMDPIGLGLENFDGMGRWRERDNGAPIDASGDLDGTSFDDPLALGQAIRDHEDFVPCAVQTLARYATGQVESEEATPVLDVLTQRFAEAHEHRMRPLLLELILSPLFRQVGPPEEAP